MKSLAFLLAVLTFVGSATNFHAQANTPQNLLQNGDFSQGLAAWNIVDTTRNAEGKVAVVDAQTGPFTKALRITTKLQPDGSYSLLPSNVIMVQQNLPATLPIYTSLIMKVWLRSLDKAIILAMLTGEDGETFSEQKLRLTPEWREYAIAGFLPQEGEPRVSFWVPRGAGAVEIAGVRLQNLSTQPQLDLQMGHGDEVNCVATSSNGRWVATGGKDMTIKLWDAASGVLKHTLDLRGSVEAIAFTPDSQTLVGAVASGVRKIQLWDVASGTLKRAITGPLGDAKTLALVDTIALHPDGQSLALTSQTHPNSQSFLSEGKRVIEIWGLDGNLLYTLAGFGEAATFDHRNGVNTTLAFSPDGRWLAAGAAQHMELWDMAKREIRLTLPKQAIVKSCVFSPDGAHLIVYYTDGIVCLWGVPSGELKRKWSDGAPSLDTKAVATAGFMVATADAQEVHLWDARDGKLQRTLTGFRLWPTSLAFSPDGKTLVIGSADKTARLWDVTNGLEKRRLGHAATVMALAAAPDGQTIAAGNEDNCIHLWDVASGEIKKTLLHSAMVSDVVFARDGQTLASAGVDGKIRLWDVADGTLRRTLEAHAPGYISIALSRDGRILASGGSQERIVKIWDAITGELKHTTEQQSGEIMSIAVSPDGNIVASGNFGPGQGMKLWDTATGRLLKTLDAHAINSVAFSPDGQSVAGSDDRGTIHIWEVASGAPRHTFERGYVPITTDTLSFSPDGRTLGMSIWKRLELLNIQTGKRRVGTRRLAGWFKSVCFAQNGRTLISGGDDGIKVWDVATHRLLASLIALPPTPAMSQPIGGELSVANGKALTADAKALTADAKLMVRPDAPRDYLAITPQGYYNSSAQADRFMRFKLGNNSFPAESFQARYYRPDLVKAVLAGQVVPLLEDLKGPYPPALAFASAGGAIASENANITLETSDDSDVKNIVFFVNGARVEAEVLAADSRPLTADSRALTADAKALTADAKALTADSRPLTADSRTTKEAPAAHKIARRFTATLPLPPDAKSIKVQAIAYDEDGLQSERGEVLFSRETATPTTMGRLLGVCVGVSRYQDATLNLRFADADATALTQVLNEQRGAYATAQVKALTNEQATREGVKAALDEVIAQASRRDTVILLLSGHGWRAGEREFYFATHEVQKKDIAGSALPWKEVTDRLTQLSQKSRRVIVLLDACHSGSAASNEDLVKAVLSANAGVMVLASSKGSEVSLENAEWGHGAFTKAMLEAVKGKAATDGVITILDFLYYVTRRVKQLTEDQQHPQVPFLQDFDGDAPIVTLAGVKIKPLN